jgi:hypothetical protein
MDGSGLRGGPAVLPTAPETNRLVSREAGSFHGQNRRNLILFAIAPERRVDAEFLLTENQAAEVMNNSFAKTSFFMATVVLLRTASPNRRLTALNTDSTRLRRW